MVGKKQYLMRYGKDGKKTLCIGIGVVFSVSKTSSRGRFQRAENAKI